MTELKPLEYAASAAVLGAIIAWAVAWEFSTHVRQQSRLLYAAPVQGILFLAGIAAGGTAVLMRAGLAPVHALADLWCPPLSLRTGRAVDSVRRYQGLRSYQGAHAA